MKVTVRPRQTLADIAIQVYGDLRAICDIAAVNAISITDDLIPGSTIECPETVYDKYLQDYVVANGISPATAFEDDGTLSVGIFTDEFTEEYE